MADNADRATDCQAVFLREALAKRPQPAQGQSLSHCEECGQPIPTARRVAVPGCRLCVSCQQEADDER